MYIYFPIKKTNGEIQYSICQLPVTLTGERGNLTGGSPDFFPPCYITIVTGAGGTSPPRLGASTKPRGLGPQRCGCATHGRFSLGEVGGWSAEARTAPPTGGKEGRRWEEIGTREMVGNPTPFFLGVGVENGWKWNLMSKDLWMVKVDGCVFWGGGEKQQYKYVCMVYFRTCLQ